MVEAKPSSVPKSQRKCTPRNSTAAVSGHLGSVLLFSSLIFSVPAELTNALLPCLEQRDFRIGFFSSLFSFFFGLVGLFTGYYARSSIRGF